MRPDLKNLEVRDFGITGTLDVQSTIQWLLKAQYSSGPVAGFLPKRCKWFGRCDVYPEITGYFLSTFSKLYLKTQDSEYFKRAELAADGLLKYMTSSGAISSLISNSGKFEDRIYLFDQGIIAQGLWDFYGAAQQRKSPMALDILAAATKATDFILRANVKGRLPDQVKNDGSVISDFTYCILGKTAPALVSAYRVIGDVKYLNAAREILDYAITNFQNTDGVFSISPEHPRNRVHYHCYAIEGLLGFAETTQESKYWEAAKRAGDYLIEYSKADGGFKNNLPSTRDDGLEDVPPCSQACLIWLRLNKQFPDGRYNEAIERAMRRLQGLVFDSASPYLRGGLPFLIPKSGFREACTWAAEFYVDITTSEIDTLKGIAK